MKNTFNNQFDLDRNNVIENQLKAPDEFDIKTKRNFILNQLTKTFVQTQLAQHISKS